MRHRPPEHGHPLRQMDPPPVPEWAQRERPTNVDACDAIGPDLLKAKLKGRGLGPTVIAGLLKDRYTAGGRWRITQELAL